MSRHSRRQHFSLHFLLAISALSKLFFGTVYSRTKPGDIKVLEDLKNALNPQTVAPGSCLSLWDFSVDPCDHLFSDRFTCGLRCDRIVSGSARVTEITLDPVGYPGSLISSKWNLPHLPTLDISDNSFSGSVPDSLSKLVRRKRLGLSRNSFKCLIHASVGSLSQLEELYLDNNDFQGPVPSTFNDLISLET